MLNEMLREVIGALVSYVEQISDGLRCGPSFHKRALPCLGSCRT